MDSYAVTMNHDQIMDFINSQPVLPFIIAPNTTDKSPKDFVLLGNVYVSKEIIQLDYRIYYMLDLLMTSMIKYEIMNSDNILLNNNFFIGQLYILTGYTDISCFRLTSIPKNDRKIIINYNNGILEVYDEKA